MASRRATVARAARLRASEQCCDLFIERGTTDVPVAEIAVAIGISQRSFHRYFPFKAESVGPFFDRAVATSNALIASASIDRPLVKTLGAAFRASLLGELADRTRALMPLVFGDAEMWSVFIRKLHDGERSVAPLLAPRLGVPVGSLRARAAAAAVASSIRIALEEMVISGADPVAVYEDLLRSFSAGSVLTPNHSARPAPDQLTDARPQLGENNEETP